MQDRLFSFKFDVYASLLDILNGSYLFFPLFFVHIFYVTPTTLFELCNKLRNLCQTLQSKMVQSAFVNPRMTRMTLEQRGTWQRVFLLSTQAFKIVHPASNACLLLFYFLFHFNVMFHVCRSKPCIELMYVSLFVVFVMSCFTVMFLFPQCRSLTSGMLFTRGFKLG